MKRTLLVATIALVFLVSCAGGGLGDLGSILGSPNQQTSSAVTGTVAAIDTANQRIDLNPDYINGLRTTANTTPIYYDSNTAVYYQNSTYRPTDLERGDQISITGSNVSGRYVAQRIDVTRNVRG